MSEELTFQEELDAAVHDAITSVCARHKRMQGPYIGLVRWFGEDGGGASMIVPDEQVVFESLGLADYLALMMNNLASDGMMTYGPECDCEVDE